MNSEYEIMAPVGSRESLVAAIQAGADSIYFGIEKLNMRAHSASTFTIDDLKEIAQTCREHGIKSYLTVNTIIYGEDIPLMHEIIDAAKAVDISAVIASDVAVMTYCNRVGQEVHLSTQLNISNIEALRFRDLPSGLRGAYLWSLRRTHPHRDVLPRCPLHGHQRQVLYEPACRQPQCQSRGVHSGVPSQLYRDRQ